MKNYLGLIIAVEEYNDSKKISKVKFANNDAKQFRESLINLGCEKSNLELLDGAKTTKTTIENKIRKLSRTAKSYDTIILYYAGHGFFVDGINKISCVDTELDSLEISTISITSIISQLEKSESTRIIIFLDCCHSGIEFSEIERSPISDFSTDDLKYIYRDAEHLIVFASCKSDEKSQADMEHNHGVWSYYLIQALQGNAKDIYTENLLFSDQLQKFLKNNTTKRVKFITPEKKNQTPVKFGKETDEKFIVADLTKLFETRKIEAKAKGFKFKEAVFSYSKEDYVRKLPGFKVGNKVPKKIDDYHENWIQKIAEELIREELDDVTELLRRILKLKLKDFQETIIENGYGQLSTVYFDYVIGVTQSETSADEYVLKRSIENFKNSETIGSEKFNKAFEKDFDTLTLRMDKDIDIEDLINHIEDIDNPDIIDVDYSTSDLSKCTVEISGFEGSIHFEVDEIQIVVNKNTSPKTLVASFQNVYKELGSSGNLKLTE
jgi:uncharacterized caspase-like protein